MHAFKIRGGGYGLTGSTSLSLTSCLQRVSQSGTAKTSTLTQASCDWNLELQLSAPFSFSAFELRGAYCTPITSGHASRALSFSRLTLLAILLAAYTVGSVFYLLAAIPGLFTIHTHTARLLCE